VIVSYANNWHSYAVQTKNYEKNIVNISSICLNLFTRYTRSNHTI